MWILWVVLALVSLALGAEIVNFATGKKANKRLRTSIREPIREPIFPCVGHFQPYDVNYQVLHLPYSADLSLFCGAVVDEIQRAHHRLKTFFITHVFLFRRTHTLPLAMEFDVPSPCDALLIAPEEQCLVSNNQLVRNTESFVMVAPPRSFQIEGSQFAVVCGHDFKAWDL